MSFINSTGRKRCNQLVLPSKKVQFIFIIKQIKNRDFSLNLLRKCLFSSLQSDAKMANYNPASSCGSKRVNYLGKIVAEIKKNTTEI